MQTEFRASLIRHHRPSLREGEMPLRPGPAPRSIHLCSHPARATCPTPATRKSPALENLRLLTKPT